MSQTQKANQFPKGVSQPAIRALETAGYTRLEQLSGASEAELLKLHGFGPKAVRIINQALADIGKPPLKP